MSGFKAYPAYKDSGVEWLGAVPKYWEVQPLKRAIARIESGTSVNAADFPAEPGSFGVLKTSCVYTGSFDWTENKTVDYEDLGRVSCPLQKNTLIISRMNTPDLVGATGLVVEAPKGIFLPDRLWQVYLEKNQSPAFFFYFTKSREYREQIKTVCSGTSASMQNLGQDDFRCLFFAEPPDFEQTQIARFLDHGTARIDALIEEQRRLIELLKQKRQAVISHAVTKGLDPTMPMKDSGVEWMGKVPAHWTVLALKWRARVKSGDGISPDLIEDQREEDKPYPVIGGNGVMGFTSRVNVSLPLIAIGRVGALCGNVHRIHQRAWISDNALILNLDRDSFDIDYLAHVLDARNLNDIADKSAQPLITGSKVASQHVPCPGYQEQLAIAKFLQATLAKIDQLTLEGVKAIQLLLERRSALISAAVTGKIDVRNWQPPATSPTRTAEAETA